MTKPLLRTLPALCLLSFVHPARAAVYASDLVPGLCMDVNSRTKTLDLWNCHGGPNQDLRPTPTGQIRSQDGLCLDTAPKSPLGNALVMSPCGQSAPGQRWAFDPRTRQFRNEQGLCADISGDGHDRGTPIIAWKCGDRVNQRWQEGQVLSLSELPRLGLPKDDQQALRSADRTITQAGGNVASANGANQVSSHHSNLIAAGDGKLVQTVLR